MRMRYSGRKGVGHTVAITGTWVPADKATGTSGTSGSSMADAKSLNVKSMAHRADTCK